MSGKKIPKQFIQSRNPRTVSYDNLNTNIEKNPKQKYRKGDEHTIPKTRYKYERVPFETFMANKYDGYKTIRSSFIPYTYTETDKYWFLGSFSDFPKDILTDFGGTCIIYDPPKKKLSSGQKQKLNYQHQFGCAMLELNEESKGLLVQPVLESLGIGEGVEIYRGRNDYSKEYVWFVLVPLHFRDVLDVVENFDHVPLVLKKEKLGPLGLYREIDLLEKRYRTSKNLTDFIDYLGNTTKQ